MSNLPPIELDEWYIGVYGKTNFFTDPIAQRPCIIGVVRNHPDVPDGTILKTAVIVSMDSKKNEVTSSMGTKYILRSIYSKYEDLFPSAQADFQKIMVESST